MPDFKLWGARQSRRYLRAPDYPEVARRTVAEMHSQVGDLKVDREGFALRGVLVRHLVMPGMAEDTREVLSWLASVSQDTYVNILDQYRPAWKANTDPSYAAIKRRVLLEEMAEAYAAGEAAGLWRFDTRWRRVRGV
jgi:putative pyruvate formate lyase activating enzyme